jgi:hypothetical protein
VVTGRGLIAASPQRTTVFNPRSQWRKVMSVMRAFTPRGAWTRQGVAVVGWVIVRWA